MVRLYRGQERNSHCKYNALQHWVLWFLPLLKESVVLLSEAAVWWESSLLQCSDVDIEPLRSKGFPLSFKQLMKQADCGESAPYWLEGAQLEAGSSWPEATCSAWTYASRPGLMTRNCCLPCWGDRDAQWSRSTSRPHRCSPKESRAKYLAPAWLPELLAGNHVHNEPP